MKGYKVFNPDWTCRGYQFEVGKTFTEDVTPVCYERGFHFCTKATDCFTYYAFTPNNKVAEVEALGDIDTNLYGSRCSTNKIHIIREITWYEVLNLVNYGKACTGFCNIGDYNSGNFNSGDWNMAHFSNGCFNTESPTIFLFNKPSDWTYQDWLSSSARLIMTSCPSNILICAQGYGMTKEEKELHLEYSVAGGFLKNVEGEAQEWWDSLTKEKKDIVMSLPNFDKYIFREITGIDVNKFVGKKG